MPRLETLTYESSDRVARITLNRPERGNGITPRMPAELAACVERANFRSEVSRQTKSFARLKLNNGSVIGHLAL